MEFECKTCHKVCQNAFDFIRHSKRKCKSTKCRDCNTVFKSRRALRTHTKKRKKIECVNCFRTLCNEDHFQRHLRTYEKRKQTANLKQQISPRSGYEEYPGYKKLLKEKENDIQDYDNETLHEKTYNRRIDSSYTYKDLRNELRRIYSELENAFKCNLGLAYILYNIVSEECIIKQFVIRACNNY